MKAWGVALLLGVWLALPAAAQVRTRARQPKTHRPAPVRRPFVLHDSLLYAAATGNTALAMRLLKRGADANGRISHADSLGHETDDNADGYSPRMVWLPDWSFVSADDTPLGVAIGRGHLPVIDLLLANGATAEWQLNAALGYVPQQVAVVRRLLAHGARPDSTGGALPALIAYNEGARAVASQLRTRRLETPAQRNRRRTRMGPRRDLPIAQPLRPDSVSLQLLRLLIEAGANPNLSNEYSPSPLHLAVRGGELGLARYLATHGAGVNALDREGNTPLHLAAQRHDLAMMRLLLGQGANPVAGGQAGNTPLHLAAETDSAEAIIGVLLLAGAEVNSRTRQPPRFIGPENIAAAATANKWGSTSPPNYEADVRNDWGATPLHRSVAAGRVGTTRLLLAAGAQVNALDDSQRTPLGLAFASAQMDAFRWPSRNTFDGDDGYDTQATEKTANNFLALVQLLLDHGADPNLGSGPGLLRTALADDDTALVRRLLAHGAEPNRAELSGRTAASYVHSLPALQLILARGARLGAGPAESPLFVSGLNAALVRASLAAGASATAIGPDGQTPLHYAVRHGDNGEIVDLYLAQKARINAVDSSGYTPLAAAAREGTQSLIGHLIDSGADPDGDPAQRPLVHAAGAGNAEVVQALLQKGAHARLPDARGNTALHAAFSRDSVSLVVVERLLAAGADVNAPDALGYSPLHRCLEQENNYSHLNRGDGQFLAVACLLLARGARAEAPNAAGESGLDVLRAHSQRSAFRVLLRELGQPVRPTNQGGW